MLASRVFRPITSSGQADRQTDGRTEIVNSKTILRSAVKRCMLTRDKKEAAYFLDHYIHHYCILLVQLSSIAAVFA